MCVLCVFNAVNVGLAVGLSVGLFFLLCVCAIPLCIIIVVCLINRRSRRRPVLQTRVVATMPYAGATVVNQTQGTSFNAPYPAQPSQAPYYPTQAGYSNRAPYPAQNIQGLPEPLTPLGLPTPLKLPTPLRLITPLSLPQLRTLLNLLVITLLNSSLSRLLLHMMPPLLFLQR